MCSAFFSLRKRRQSSLIPLVEASSTSVRWPAPSRFRTQRFIAGRKRRWMRSRVRSLRNSARAKFVSMPFDPAWSRLKERTRPALRKATCANRSKRRRRSVALANPKTSPALRFSSPPPTRPGSRGKPSSSREATADSYGGLHLNPCRHQPGGNSLWLYSSVGTVHRETTRRLDGTFSGDHRSDQRDGFLLSVPRRHARHWCRDHFFARADRGDIHPLRTPPRRRVAQSLRDQRNAGPVLERVRFGRANIAEDTGAESDCSEPDRAAVSHYATFSPDALHRAWNCRDLQIPKRAGRPVGPAQPRASHSSLVTT